MMKYLHVLSIGVQNTLVYRVNFLFRAAFGLVPLMGTLYVWRAIYAGKADGELIGAYTLSGMVSYYLLVNFVDALTAVAEDDWQIAADIKDGNISQFLLKPIDYLAYRLCLYLSGRAIYTSVALVPVKSIVAEPTARSTVTRTTISPPPSMGTRAAPSDNAPIARRTQASALAWTKLM